MTDNEAASGGNGERGSYNERFLTADQLAPFLTDPTAPAEQVQALLAHQRLNCDAIRIGHELLPALEIRSLMIGDSQVVVQFNAERAKRPVNKGSGCFLDANQLLDGQMAIPHEDVLILGNPYPIIDKHATMPTFDHIDQRLGTLLQPAFALSQELNQDFLVFYNGPEAGATAPDHAHLQGGSRALLPIEADLAAKGMGEQLVDEEHLQIYLPDNLGRTAVVLQGINRARLGLAIEYIMDGLTAASGRPEALVNVVFTYDQDQWTVYLFPRRQFRPKRYGEGAGQFKISPASLEMAGIMVVTRQQDYDSLTAADVIEIYDDVSLERAAVRELAIAA